MNCVNVADRPEAAPANEPERDPGDLSLLGLVESTLKSPARLDAAARDEASQVELVPRLLGIALLSYSGYALAMLLILNSVPAEAWPNNPLPVPAARWSDRSGLALVAAYDLGLVGATGICLPTFYFFSLLAGVRMSMLQVVGQVVRGTVSSAVILVGILPIYVAVVLGLAVFEAPPEVLSAWLYLGLALPFLAGLEGVRAIYRGVTLMADTLPPERRGRRGCFLRRLTASWAACYTAVSPVLIYRLWQFFGT